MLVITVTPRNQNAVVVYTNFVIAFDNCDHGVFAHRMRTICILGTVGKWIFNFLTHRTHRVVILIEVNTEKSSISKVKSSVFQGTVQASCFLFS